MFLLLGFALTGRSFAYLCIPPAKLFIGDLTLAAFVLLRPRKLFDPWMQALTLLIWGLLSRRMTRVVTFGAAITALLAIGFLLDLTLPSSAERGGAISSSEIVARGISAVSPDLAKDLTGSENTGFYRGTVTWRERWWRTIWANSPENYSNLLIGPGYGFMLRDLVNYLKDSGAIRTPHSVFFYALVAGPTLAYGFDAYHPNGVIHGKSANALVIQ